MHFVLLRSHNALVQAPSAMSSRTVLTRLYLKYGLRALASSNACRRSSIQSPQSRWSGLNWRTMKSYQVSRYSGAAVTGWAPVDGWGAGCRACPGECPPCVCPAASPHHSARPSGPCRQRYSRSGASHLVHLEPSGTTARQPDPRRSAKPSRLSRRSRKLPCMRSGMHRSARTSARRYAAKGRYGSRQSTAKSRRIRFHRARE